MSGHPARRTLSLPRRAGAVALVAAAGASIGCGAEFVPAHVITDARVIAVTADPPEAVPGQEVSLTPLVVSPSGELTEGGGFQATWWRCPETDSDALGDFVQCTNPSDRTDIGTGVPYVDTVPTDLFGEPPAPGEEPLPGDKLLGAILGYWRVVGLSMRAGDRRVESFKRIPVYLPVPLATLDERLAGLDVHVRPDGAPLPPNTNPTLSGVTVREGSPTGGVVTSVARDGTYFLQPIYDERVLEDYVSLKVDLAGLDVSDPETLREVPLEDLVARFEKVQRCEIPTFSWFVTHGRLRRDTTLDESVVTRVFDLREVDCPPVDGDERAPENRYTPPTGEADDPLPADGVVRGWVVLRDGRGGTATRSFQFSIE